MLIGGDDISNDVINLGTYFSVFVYIRPCFCFALIGENLKKLSQRGATGELEVEFKFQRRSLPAPPPEHPGELARRLVSQRYGKCWREKKQIYTEHVLIFF